MKTMLKTTLLLTLCALMATVAFSADSNPSIRMASDSVGQPVLIVPALAEPSATGNVIYFEDWEWGQGSWEIDVNACWAIGETSGGSPSVPVDEACAGTGLGSDHPETSGGYLTKPDLTLPLLGHPDEQLILWFRHWANCFNSSDYGQVRVDAGEGMVEVGPKIWRYTSGWSWTSVDLTAYAGTNIDLGFYFQSVNTHYSGYDDNRQGWFIDDIQILQGVLPAPRLPVDFSYGQGNWNMTHGNWFVRTPTAGPGDSYRGDHCLSVVPWGDHPEDCSSSAVSPVWTIPDLGTGEDVIITYTAWLNTFNSSDYYDLAISRDGEEWEIIDGPHSGYSSGWNDVSTVIPNCVGQDLRIRFYFRGVNTHYSGYDDNRYGVSIDHIYFQGLGLLAQDVAPYPGDMDVDLSNTIRVDFSDPADTATIDASSFVVKGSESGIISGTFNYAPDGLAFEFTPDMPFLIDEVITCRLTDDVLDLHGLALDGNGDLQPGGDRVWRFTTGSSPIPVFINDLTATANNDGVLVTWSASEATPVDLFRLQGNTGSFSWDISIGSDGASSFFAQDAAAARGDVSYTLYYRESTASAWGSIENVSINLDDNLPRAASTIPLSAYPNPFNPKTQVSFTLDRGQQVRLDLYDVAGRMIRTLHTGDTAHGTHVVPWDGTTDQGHSAPSGIYFARLSAEDGQSISKLMLVR